MGGDFLKLVVSFGKAAAKFGPEVYELGEVFFGMFSELKPQVLDLIERIKKELSQESAVSIMSASSLADEFPELESYCDGKSGGEVSAMARGQFLKRIADFIRANPELIGIIIGLLGEEKTDE